MHLHAVLPAVVLALWLCSIGAHAKYDPLVGIGEKKIVGGRRTSILKYPVLVSVERYFTEEQKWFHQCGGTILNHNHILTAGSSLLPAPKDKYRIRAGTTTRGVGGKLYTVVKVFYHPKVTAKALDYDVGLLRTKETIVYSFAVKPIKLPSLRGEPRAGTFLNVAGWGAKSEASIMIEKSLRATVVSIIPRAKCASDYRGYKAVTDRMVCAASLGRDACQGDAGGPLMKARTGVQYGIVSWGRGCGRKDRPGVYTNLANAEIRSYINKVLKS